MDMILKNKYIHKARYILIVILLTFMSSFLVSCDDTSYTWITCTACGGSGRGHLDERTGNWTKCYLCRGSGKTVKGTSNRPADALDGFDIFIIIAAFVGFIVLAFGGLAVAIPEGHKASKPFKKFCFKFYPAWILSFIFALWLHGSQIIGTGSAIGVYMACLLVGFGVVCWFGGKAQDKAIKNK